MDRAEFERLSVELNRKPVEFDARGNYKDSRYEDLEEYEEDIEDRYNSGDTNIVLYRLMKYLPSDPEKLYSAVGQTGFGSDRMGTTEFSLHGVNTDIKGQGFFAEASPTAAATWLQHYAHGLKDANNTIPAELKDPFNYAVFPIAPGKIYNDAYWQEHPEILEVAQFGLADGLLVDDFTIIGDPIYQWSTAYTEDMQNQDNNTRANYRELENVMLCMERPELLTKYWKLTDTQKQSLADGAKKALAEHMRWEKAWKSATQDWRHAPPPPSYLLEPTVENESMIIQWINANL